jgi:uncharacterized protein (DUF2267 family)
LTGAAAVARAVFKMLSFRIFKGEIQDIKAILPKNLVALWPSTF